MSTQLVDLATLEEQLAVLHERIATLVKKPAYLEMPPDGLPFNEVAYQTIPAIGTAVTILTFQVPGGQNGAIKWIGNNYVGAGWTEGTGDLIYRLLADGQPIRNFENILGSLGSPAAPSETAPIRIYEGQTIALACTNVAVVVAGQLLGGRLSGWYYPIDYDAQAEGVTADEQE